MQFQYRHCPHYYSFQIRQHPHFHPHRQSHKKEPKNYQLRRYFLVMVMSMVCFLDHLFQSIYYHRQNRPIHHWFQQESFHLQHQSRPR
jgi:hypothetical protein